MGSEDEIATRLEAPPQARPPARPEAEIETRVRGGSEDDVRTVAPPTGGSLRASVSGMEATVPGAVEFTAPGYDNADSSPPPQRAPSPGERIGTFVVEKELGRGAMGIVLLAHDPELDRRVAIKLLIVDERDPKGSVRLLREAQSAAGIAHPNVVAVHQVGTHEDQVYVVMEFVEGGTLRDWVEDKPRTWSEILDAYVQAGRGLAAAHRLGFVHRDFKPDNALIGHDGRVRVSDFGLVGRSGDTQESGTTLRSFDSVADRLTQTGTIMGTPAYMPREQLAGHKVDARSDQFSYCVALYEALWGQRPFAGESLAMIFSAIDRGEIAQTPPDDIPDSVRTAIVRGLAALPDDRHVDMDTLVTALQAWRTPPSRRAPIAAAGLALLGLGAAGAYALTANNESPADPFVCPDATEGYGDAWSEERRASVKAAFGSKPNGQEMFATLDAELEARRLEWQAGHASACEARRADEQSDAIFGLRMGCLQARAAEADLFSELLIGEDTRLVDGALSSATTLLPIAACEDVEALQSVEIPTAEQTEALLPLRRELARARILLLAGRHQEVVSLMNEQIGPLREAGYAAELAAGLEIQARAQMQVAEYDKAETNLREALTLAAQARAHGTEARAVATLIFIVGQRQQRYDEALGMLPAGRSAAARSSDPRARSYLDAAIATLYVAQAKYDEAGVALDRVVETLEALDRPPPDELANAYANRADLATRMGDDDAALRHHEHAVTVVEEGLGKNHPFFGAFAMQLAMALESNGKFEPALKRFEDTLVSWEASYGHDHPTSALAVLYIGMLERKMGDLEAATASFEDGLARHEKAESEEPRGLVSLLDNLASTRREQGQWSNAWDAYSKARAVVLRTEGEDDPRLSHYDRSLAGVLVGQGKYTESLEYLQRARIQMVRLHGPKHPEVANASALIADAHRMLGDCKTAQRHYGNALKIRSDLEVPPDATLAHLLVGSGQCDLEAGARDSAREAIEHAAALAKESTDIGVLAGVEFAQAKLAWDGGDKDGARDAASSARDRLANSSAEHKRQAARVQAWLLSHAADG